MGRAGRPKLLQKDGHHRHDGYSRWHPSDQSHKPNLHIDLQKSNDVSDVFIGDDSGPAHEIYNLVLSLEKMEKLGLGWATKLPLFFIQGL